MAKKKVTKKKSEASILRTSSTGPQPPKASKRPAPRDSTLILLVGVFLVVAIGVTYLIIATMPKATVTHTSIKEFDDKTITGTVKDVIFEGRCGRVTIYFEDGRVIFLDTDVYNPPIFKIGTENRITYERDNVLKVEINPLGKLPIVLERDKK